MRSFSCLQWCLFLALLPESHVFAHPHDGLVARQDRNTASTTAARSTASPALTATDNSAQETGTTAKTTASNSRGATGSATKSGKSSATGTATRVTTKVIDPAAAAGGVQLQTPATSDGSQYYKIGDYVTFGWNYTNLLVTPTAVNVQAYCSSNAQYYPIASNLTFSDMEVVWNTTEATEDRSVPFLQAYYTLVIFDESNPGQATAVPSAGYLQPFNSYKFAMYTKQPYAPLTEFQCAVCGSGAVNFDLKLVRMILGMGLITSLTFTWFISGVL